MATWYPGGAAPSAAVWTSLATDGAGNWIAIAYGSTATMVSTNNGVSWVAGGPAPFSVNWQSLATDKRGTWVAVAYGSTHTMVSSNNGVTWTSGGSAPSGANWISLATDTFGNWIAIAQGSTATMRSTNNGATWTAGGAASASVNWTSLATDKLGHWVAIAQGSTATMVSSNYGTTWIGGGPATASTTWTSLATDGKGVWAAVSSSGSGVTMLSRNNGTTWLNAGPTPVVDDWDSLVTDGNGTWVAIAGGGSDNTMYTTNILGDAWTIGGAAPSSSRWNALATDTYGNYVAVSGLGGLTMTSLYEGVSTDVPGTYDVSISAHGYMSDSAFEFGRRDSFRHSSIPAQKDATDITNQPGESTINPQGLWRSEFEDWSWGSGQLFFDRHDSVPNRYHHGQGVDVFTNKWYASQLPDTVQLTADTNSSLQVLVVGAYLYKLDSLGVQYSTDGVTYTTVQGLTSVVPIMMCTDGNTVYIAAGNGTYGGVWTTTAGSIANAINLVSVSGQNVTFVAYCSNVLLVGNGPSLYQISGMTTSWPTALITQSEATWNWNCAAGGSGWIYIGGFSGGAIGTASVSAVYKTQFTSDGVALVAPTVASPMPPGESVYSLFVFVNYILMGTSLGVRFCQTEGLIDPSGQDTGLLKIGPIIPNLQEKMTAPVWAFTANQRFVYFGWSNYSASNVLATSTCTGLGWMDISNFTGEQTPAYTSHLMVAGSGHVTSMDWWNGAPVFVVQGQGVYTAASTYVASSNIYSGYIGFRIPDQKVLIAYSVDTTSTAGSVTASINQDDETTNPLSTMSGKVNVFSIPTLYGELFETDLTLNATSSNNVPTTVRRATLQAYPAITAGKNIIVALRFYDEVQTHAGRRAMNVYSEMAFLENLRYNQNVVVYQEGANSWNVTVDNLDMVWYDRSELPNGGFQGIMVVTLKSALSGLLT